MVMSALNPEQLSCNTARDVNYRKDAPLCYDGTYTILPVVVQQVPL